MDPIVQAREAAFRCGLTPDQFWRLTPWELQQWLKPRNKERQDEAMEQMRTAITTGWHAAWYARQKTLSGAGLRGDLMRIQPGDGRLSPEASADAMRSWLSAGKAAAKQQGAN
ncbi:MAG: phage tail assembly chaperone [Candidatus Marinimicrobia bacterium]|nr:phage tail assembly chaperone [Candidatus Neomarinimicrobiota bacterium]